MARSLSLVTPIAVLLSVAVASLAGCGEPAPRGPYISFDPCQPLALVTDADATPQQMDGLAAGIALWNSSLLQSQLSIVGPAGGAAGSPAPEPSVPVHFQAAAGNFHGFYDAPSGQVFLNVDLSGHPAAVVTAHEIGHAFGLPHVPADQRRSVMNPGNLSNEPTAEDIDTLEDRWGRCERLEPALAASTPSP